MKKWLSIVCLVFLLMGCASQTTEEKTQKLTMDVIVENKETNEILFDDEVTVHASGNKLSDFLEASKDLQVEMKDDKYGKTIVSILEVKTKDWNKGPWWTFSSDTNENCKDGYCMLGCSELEVKNGDQFVFTFSSSFE